MNIKKFYNKFIKNHTICIDSRKNLLNSVFFGIKGKNFNGNEFANEAINKGALFAFVDDIKFLNSKNKNIIFIENSIKIIQKLAKFYRKYILKAKVIAITGSNGKTTTKNLCSIILSKKFKIYSTKGNYNNYIGVPITILSTPINTQIMIIEIGASINKEIKLLCSIVQPDYGYITSFGESHLHGFNNIENIVKEKLELYKYLRLNNKIVFINIDDKIQLNNFFGIKNTYKFSKNFNYNSNIYVKVKNNINGKLCFILKKQKIISNIIGIYNSYNIIASIVIGYYFGISIKDIKISIESYYPYNRSQIIKYKKNINLILDAYNANPTSMKQSIINFISIKQKKKIVILGDMLDLGILSDKYHKKIVILLLYSNINTIFLVGKIFYNISIYNKKIKYFLNKLELIIYLKKYPIKKGIILIKGSRKMKMETIIDYINND